MEDYVDDESVIGGWPVCDGDEEPPLLSGGLELRCG